MSVGESRGRDVSEPRIARSIRAFALQRLVVFGFRKLCRIVKTYLKNGGSRKWNQWLVRT